MAEFEEKFYVVNYKYLNSLTHPYYKGLIYLIMDILNRVLPKNKYYVCNQDEPYADEVLQVILAGEDKKK
ncbi:MAG: hypothetical protein IMF19_16760 [Proteobacteria bacterium]|nr:hypothetical protein [Pseudomonadota bacterium]